MNEVLGTVADIHAAFAEWERRYRAGELEDFLSDVEIRDMTPYEYGASAGEYFLSILEEIV